MAWGSDMEKATTKSEKKHAATFFISTAPEAFPLMDVRSKL